MQEASLQNTSQPPNLLNFLCHGGKNEVESIRLSSMFVPGRHVLQRMRIVYLFRFRLQNNLF